MVGKYETVNRPPGVMLDRTKKKNNFKREANNGVPVHSVVKSQKPIAGESGVQ
jgi:hypothetical protein